MGTKQKDQCDPNEEVGKFRELSRKSGGGTAQGAPGESPGVISIARPLQIPSKSPLGRASLGKERHS